MRSLVRRPFTSPPRAVTAADLFDRSHALWPSSYPSLTFLGDSRMQSREICVFPVYLLRGHVPCNRFSPSSSATDRESNAPSQFFFLSLSLSFLLARIGTGGQLFFQLLYVRGDIYIHISSFTRNGWTGYGSWKRRVLSFSIRGKTNFGDKGFSSNLFQRLLQLLS